MALLFIKVIGALRSRETWDLEKLELHISLEALARGQCMS